MIKYIGLLFIFIESILIGFSFNEKLNNKIKILKSVKSLLQQFKIEIAYRMPTLIELFSEYTDESILQLTNNISENLKNGLTSEKSVINGVEFSSCVRILSKEEKYFITDALSKLGTSDTDGQISLLENAVERIDYYIENAIEDKRKNSKVYMTASIYIGLVIIIVLL